VRAAGFDLLGRVSLSAAYSELGQDAEARAEVAEVLRLNPKFSLKIHKQRVLIKDPAVLERHTTLAYTERFLPFSYWRTSTGLEVDLIVGELDLAVEFKAMRTVDEQHTKGLLALQEEQRVKRAIVVSLDPVVRKLASGIIVYPWQTFCQKLWADEFVV
jgi:predicted AAA+ superfamily ATPase